jgi:hypothetical protein
MPRIRDDLNQMIVMTPKHRIEAAARCMSGNRHRTRRIVRSVVKLFRRHGITFVEVGQLSNLDALTFCGNGKRCFGTTYLGTWDYEQCARIPRRVAECLEKNFEIMVYE